MAAPVGPTSSNPGPWLTTIIVDSICTTEPALRDQSEEYVPQSLRGRALEQYKEARTALESFKFKPRERTIRIPLETNLPGNKPSVVFEESGPELETRSFAVFKDEDADALTAHELGHSFPMIEQPHVLSGPTLQKYLTERWTPGELMMLSTVRRNDAAEDADDRDEQSDEESEKLKAIEMEDSEASKIMVLQQAGYVQVQTGLSTTATVVKTKMVTVTRAELNSQHSLWVANPSQEHHQRLTELAYYFACRKTRLAPKKDSLRIAGHSDDFQSDSVISMMKLFESKRKSGYVIDHPYAFICTVWENGRKEALRNLSEQRKREDAIDQPVGSTDELSDDSDFQGKPTSLDEYQHDQFARDKHHSFMTESSEEQKRLDRWALYESLPDDERNLVGLHLQSNTQARIGMMLGRTQQAISKKLRKIREKAQIAPEKAVTR